MILQKASIDDLTKIMPWIKDENSCLMWGGPLVRFPLIIENLIEDIDFKRNNSLALFGNSEIVGFGQLVEKEKHLCHIARIVVSFADQS